MRWYVWFLPSNFYLFLAIWMLLLFFKQFLQQRRCLSSNTKCDRSPIIGVPVLFIMSLASKRKKIIGTFLSQHLCPLLSCHCWGCKVTILLLCVFETQVVSLLCIKMIVYLHGANSKFLFSVKLLARKRTVMAVSTVTSTGKSFDLLNK